MDGQQPDALGPEIAENYEIESLDQLRVISDELRVRILDTLARRQLTVTQLGELLGQAPARVHYHTRELERAGLVRLVETRERGGILEKYYRAVARHFTVSDALLHAAPPDEVLSALREQLNMHTRGFTRSVEAVLQQREQAGTPGSEQAGARGLIGLNSARVWITGDEGKHLMREILDLLAPYSTPRGVAGERERAVVLLAYDPQLAGTEPGPGDESTAKPRTRRVVIAGAASFDRAELERAVAQGERLVISVFGGVTFASDVTPELADRAIERFRYRGILNASPAVREVLTRKEHPEAREG